MMPLQNLLQYLSFCCEENACILFGKHERPIIWVFSAFLRSSWTSLLFFQRFFAFCGLPYMGQLLLNTATVASVIWPTRAAKAAWYVSTTQFFSIEVPVGSPQLSVGLYWHMLPQNRRWCLWSDMDTFSEIAIHVYQDGILFIHCVPSPLFPKHSVHYTENA